MARKSRRSDKSDALRRVPLFAACSDRELERIGELTTQVSVRDGQKVCTEGELGKEFYVLLEGNARIDRADGTGTEIGPGDYFGELALFVEGGPRTATVTMSGDGELLVLSGPELRELLRAVPEIAIRMLAELGARLHGVSLPDRTAG